MASHYMDYADANTVSDFKTTLYSLSFPELAAPHPLLATWLVHLGGLQNGRRQKAWGSPRSRRYRCHQISHPRCSPTIYCFGTFFAPPLMLRTNKVTAAPIFSMANERSRWRMFSGKTTNHNSLSIPCAPSKAHLASFGWVGGMMCPWYPMWVIVMGQKSL